MHHLLHTHNPKVGEGKVSLKLLIDTNTKKVLFAQAGKDFIDFLFHIFSLPLGTVANLLAKKSMAGCVGDLFESIEALNPNCLQLTVTKDSVLKAAMVTSSVALKLPFMLLSGKIVYFYRCTSQFCKGCEDYVTDFPRTICPRCKGQMSAPVSYVVPKCSTETTSSRDDGLSGGYVKGVVSYMVMDNLEVRTMSTISGITFISKFNVKEVTSLTEKEVQVGLTEGIALLKASLETKSALTTVFLRK